jgi:hypothetical protein
VDSSKAEERMISSLSGLSLYSDLSSKGGGGGDKQFVQKGGGGEGGSGNKGEGVVFQ